MSEKNRIVKSCKARARINLDGRLDTEVSGASTLEYIGDPTLGDINSSGASTIRKK